MDVPAQTYFYRIYGLCIAANRPLPNLIPCPASPASIAINIHNTFPENHHHRVWLENADYASQRRFDQGEQPNLNILQSEEGRYLRFDYAQGHSFIVDLTTQAVDVSSQSGSISEDYFAYLVGPILGFILRLRGVLPLHASSIDTGSGAFAIGGASGAGKSTTASVFLQQGCRLLSDDVTPLTNDAGGWHIQPGYPRLRLWQDAVKLTSFNAESLQPVVNHAPKFFIPVEETFQPESQLLRAIFLITERNSTIDKPLVQPFSQSAALLSLVEHTYVNYLISPRMRVLEFNQLNALIRQIPVFRVSIPHELARLPSLCAAVLETLNDGLDHDVR